MKKAASLMMILSILFCLSGCGRSQIRLSDDGFEYNGKTYDLTAKTIFSHYSDLFNGREQEGKFSNCELEYTGEGKIKFIEYRSKNIWYALDDHFLIRYDNSMYYMFSRVWLYTDTGLTQPDFTPENISEIQECVGVPKYNEYDVDRTFEKADNTLKKRDEWYLYDSRIINDKAFFERFINEYNEEHDVDSLIDEAKKANADTIKEAQAKRDRQIGPNETVTVYYKVSFKDSDFPFKLIFRKLSEK